MYKYLQVHEFDHGSLVIGMACCFIANRRRMWLIRIEIQETKTPAAVRFTNHQNTVMASLDRLIKLRKLKVMNSSTHTYGTPQEVVLKKILGACCLRANPYKTRVPARRL